jgi:hypothetical protein
MKNIFFAPVSSGGLYLNFEKSVINGIDSIKLKTLEKFKGESESVHLWGIRDAKKTTYLATQKYDIVAFYKEGYIVAFAEVKNTLIDLELSKSIWGSFINKTNGEVYYWPNIILFSYVSFCSIPFNYIKELANYNEKFSIRGYLKLNETGMNSILEKFGSSDNFFNEFSTIRKLKE